MAKTATRKLRPAQGFSEEFNVIADPDLSTAAGAVAMLEKAQTVLAIAREFVKDTLEDRLLDHLFDDVFTSLRAAQDFIGEGPSEQDGEMRQTWMRQRWQMIRTLAREARNIEDTDVRCRVLDLVDVAMPSVLQCVNAPEAA